MKKLLSILLCLTMLFSVFAMTTMSASAASAPRSVPTVRIITNEGSPVNGEFETYFTIRFDNFIDIKGIDVVVTAIDAKITGVQTAGGLPTAVDDINSKEENYDLSTDKTTLHFVDFTDTAKGRIIIKAVSPKATAKINVKGEYASDGDTLFDITTEDNIFEIKQEVVVKDATGTKLSQPATSTNTFLPYGSVYTQNGEEVEYAEKAADGSFDTSAGSYKYSPFNLYKAGTAAITPFGVAEKLTGDALMFGNYSEYDDCATADDVTAVQHGTLVFEGDWLSLKEYYIKNGNTVQEFVAALYADYNKRIPADGSTKRITYKVPSRTGNGTVKVNLYKFPRVNYMWRDGAGKLEYAIRLHGAKENTTYTSVAYCVDAQGNVYLSHHVKSATLGEDTSGDIGGTDTPDTPDTPVEPETPVFTLMEGDTISGRVVTPKLASGTVNGDTVTLDTCVAAHATRLYTVNTYKTAQYSTVTVPADTRVFIQYWNEDGSYNSGSGWLDPGTQKINSNPALFKITYSGTAGGNDASTPPADGLKLNVKPGVVIENEQPETPDEPDEPEEPEEPAFTLMDGDTIADGVVSPKLASGTVNGNNNLTIDTCVGTHSIRLYTVNNYRVSEYTSITVGANCRIFVQFWKEDGTYTDGSGWITGATTKELSKMGGYSGATYFKITFDSADGTTTPPADGLKLNVNPDLLG